MRIQKSKFKNITSESNIVGVYSYAVVPYKTQASWGSDYIYLEIQPTTSIGEIGVNIIVFYY